MQSLAGLVLALLALPATAAEPFPLAVGGTADVPGTGLHLTFVEVTSDNRCPKNVQCIVAGEAKVVFRVETDGEPVDVRFEVPPGGGAKSRFREWDLEIVELLPEPVAGEEIDAADYVAHVRVEARQLDSEGIDAKISPRGALASPEGG